MGYSVHDWFEDVLEPLIYVDSIASTPEFLLILSQRLENSNLVYRDHLNASTLLGSILEILFDKRGATDIPLKFKEIFEILNPDKKISKIFFGIKGPYGYSTYTNYRNLPTIKVRGLPKLINRKSFRIMDLRRSMNKEDPFNSFLSYLRSLDNDRILKDLIHSIAPHVIGDVYYDMASTMSTIFGLLSYESDIQLFMFEYSYNGTRTTIEYTIDSEEKDI